jgi:hypothetical protein
MISSMGQGEAAAIDAFIDRWQGREGGQERANYALFLTEFCAALGLRPPDPAAKTRERNDYVFERAVDFKEPDGSQSTGRIDLYKRGSFVLEAKQTRQAGGGKALPKQIAPDGLGAPEPLPRGKRTANRGWDVHMLNARRQAEAYAKALPADHGWPPFLIVCDVGHCFEVFADFSGQGKNYAQFPDRQGFRIYLEDLRDPEIVKRLRAIWNDPAGLDPTRASAKVTRDIAERLAAVSRALERDGQPAETVALFLMRCLFTMFAEDVELLPKDCFSTLLLDCEANPAAFIPLLEELWRTMDGGGFSTSIKQQVKRFNGSLFASARALKLGREEIGELRRAAEKDWREVEPAIFGTLLEQALDPDERRRLGAHYTPRAYVEKLVVATVIEPLRADWEAVQTTAERLKADGKERDAAAVVRKFHETLRETRVLDPACGTGNFLYVALELMKRLEGEVLEALADLGGQEALTGLEGSTIDPHQFLGLEINPRAAAIAELVLWIGYLQWHFRTKGAAPSEPILRAFKNINGGRKDGVDAVLAYDGRPEMVRDDLGKPVTRQGDGGSVLEVYRYRNPSRPTWPTADYIIGNPPFVGGKDIRGRMGEGYVEALWAAHPWMNESADFVMYWWDHAATLLTAKGAKLKRFGFVTTNSITQEFSRRVMARHLKAKKQISLLMAIPDHPWTKATRDAAAVRIAMTVAAAGKAIGRLIEVKSESGLDSDEPKITTTEATGSINPDLTVGADVTSLQKLLSNEFISSRGVVLHGAGFILSPEEARALKLGVRPGLENHIRQYRNGRDLTSTPRGVLVIDLFGLHSDEVRARFPEVYQHILVHVKPERDQNVRAYRREKWWLFGENVPDFRKALKGLPRYIATVETSKHRVFQFLDASILPDNMLVCMGLADGFFLGVLSSRVHVVWALRAGGWLGVGNDPRYSKSRCFDPFAFPAATDSQRADIQAIAEELDAHRKARQAEHPGLTITQMYNVLEKLRAGEALSPEDEAINSAGLALILKELHDKLDKLVFEAYGWSPELSDDELLTKLVALNAERAAEEKRGLIRWLRPEYQLARAGIVETAEPLDEQEELGLTIHEAKTQKPMFPTDEREQTVSVFQVLLDATGPLDSASIAALFRQGKRIEPKVEAILSAMVRLGQLVTSDDGRAYRFRRAA